ncbi:hypothetical protein BK735_21650 [Bacillus mycoides]|uniref:DUF6944 family repetitive protein n=1 Tax=Bacillus TaxID=1386 RepID=UPI000279847C|nr:MULTISPECIES: hypothetical protein [Bacillus]EJR99335.1 hypothetical protein IKO_05296 [Bacillus cereus VDM034]EJS11398.1 hypothetical protein IKS_05506 [Bacillus cereus VDM062]MBG9687760.1 hypothetical protein [Bacillus mycoides]MBG9721785.1 hypothetical protein [Bacillus mycoides]MBJ7960341.1 hypothetical protein [Bacillus cereus group sp. N28]
MDNSSKQIFASVIVAVGTILAAIGASPLNFIKSNLREDLNLYGNVLQAGGNALQAEGQGNILRKIGKEFQAIGNTTVITGLVIDFKTQTKQKLFITGNWIQALGGFINVGHGIELTPFPGHAENLTGNILQATGNSLQAMGGIYELKKNGNEDKIHTEHSNGNSSQSTEEGYESEKNKNGDKIHVEHNNGHSLQTMGRVYGYGSRSENYIEHNDGESLVITGSWIQAIGSVISLIGTIKEETQGKQLEESQ